MKREQNLPGSDGRQDYRAGGECMSRHTSSPRERINIYIGNIRKLTGDCADKKHVQSICGRRLLAYGLLDTGCRKFFGRKT